MKKKKKKKNQTRGILWLVKYKVDYKKWEKILKPQIMLQSFYKLLMW